MAAANDAKTNGSEDGAILELQMLLYDDKRDCVKLGRLMPPHVKSDNPVGITDERAGASYEPKEPGLYILILEGGTMRDLARLSFAEGRPVSDQEGEQKIRWKKEEREEKKGEGEKPAAENSNMVTTRNKQYYLKIRMYPASSCAILVLFDSGEWTLTRQYEIIWSSLCSMLTGEVPSFWNRDLPRVDFQGQLINSEKFAAYVCLEMSPSIMDFGHGNLGNLLGEGVGGAVHKFRCHDRYSQVSECAIKVKFTEECTTEDKETDMLSRFKDKRITKFYQAWAKTGDFERYLYEMAGLEVGKCQKIEMHGDYEVCSSDDNLEVFVEGGGDLVDEEISDSYVVKYVFIQMEYCGRTLEDYIVWAEGREENRARSWAIFQGITAAVNHVHEMGIVHLDLKPGNIFIGPAGVIKLGDFGQSLLKQDKFSGHGGTPGYRAPELIRGLGFSEKVDIYSIGVIFFELFGRFEKGERCEAVWKLGENEIKSDWNGDTYLLEKMIAVQPSDRPSADDILKYIRMKMLAASKNTLVEAVKSTSH